MDEQGYVSVSRLTRYIKDIFENNHLLQKVYIKGEISNFKHHSRGHMYFTIKDSDSQISAVMFSSRTRGLQFQPKDGQKVLVEGSITVYEKTGQYQIYVNKMTLDGIGSLYEKYIMLRNKLKNEGYFEEHNKKQLPKFPKKIAVITSPTGAAVKDIISTIRRRYKLVEVIVFPALVQGVDAKNSIANAIYNVNQYDDIDVIICGRGGGSIEDLWAFNEEVVANAIFNSNIPIISAVGHETDFTIADFVADFRAPTPTAAAEIAVPDTIELFKLIEKDQSKLSNYLNNIYYNNLKSYNYLINSTFFRNPEKTFYKYELLLDQYLERLKGRQPINVFKDMQNRYIDCNDKLNNTYKHILEKHQYDFEGNLDKMHLLNPLNIMSKGYSFVSRNNEIITSIDALKIDDKINIKFKDGNVLTNVIKIEEGENI